jgi:hypothetical protein
MYSIVRGLCKLFIASILIKANIDEFVKLNAFF